MSTLTTAGTLARTVTAAHASQTSPVWVCSIERHLLHKDDPPALSNLRLSAPADIAGAVMSTRTGIRGARSAYQATRPTRAEQRRMPTLRLAQPAPVRPRRTSASADAPRADETLCS